MIRDGDIVYGRVRGTFAVFRVLAVARRSVKLDMVDGDPGYLDSEASFWVDKEELRMCRVIEGDGAERPVVARS